MLQKTDKFKLYHCLVWTWTHPAKAKLKNGRWRRWRSHNSTLFFAKLWLRYDFHSHRIKISKRTPLNRLKSYNLHRSDRNVDEELVRQCILRELDGSGSLLGYRSMWRNLHSKYGINIPRSVAQVLLVELDPVGTQQRKAHRLKRWQYCNPGPNYCWHSDGYDKLKPFGFPIHACIDGFSWRVIWLKLTSSNNDPRIIVRIIVLCRKYKCISSLPQTLTNR